jgi:hypothetical protein
MKILILGALPGKLLYEGFYELVNFLLIDFAQTKLFFCEIDCASLKKQQLSVVRGIAATREMYSSRWREKNKKNKISWRCGINSSKM